MQVVGAAVFLKNGKYLIAKRKPGGSLANKWEFPGGKIEAGETPEQGLARELFEEFEITIAVKDFLASHPFENKGRKYLLKAYLCEKVSGEPVLHEHTAVAWIDPDDFKAYDLADSDKAIIDEIVRHTSGFKN
jgi:8-oxo-dGTP diphosphatase